MLQPILKTVGQFVARKQRLPVPKLIGRDLAYQGVTISFQFPPDRIQESFRGVWADEMAFGRDHPVLQYIGHESGMYRFTALFFAETAANEILSQIQALKKAVRRDPALNRPPIWSFIWGDFLLDEAVIVESIGDIEYTGVRPGELGMNGLPSNIGMAMNAKSILESDNLIEGAYKTAQALSWHKPDPQSGLPTQGLQLRAASVNVTLRHYEPFVVEVTDPNAPAKSGFFHSVKDGDTYEGVAKTHYGDPGKGDLLRRQNPGQLNLIAGQTVVIPHADTMRGMTPTPSSIPLQRSTEGNAFRAAAFEQRRRNTLNLGPQAGE